MLKHPTLAAFGAIALLALPLQALPDDDRDDFHKRDWRWERHEHSRGPDKRPSEAHSPQVELPKPDTTTKTVEPAGNNIGHGSSDIAVALAKASLAKHGIHNPTRDQLNAALRGGTIITKSGQRVTLPGVLKLRATGMGWGQVAHKLGVKVGDVKGHGHAHKKDDDRRHHKHAKHHDRDDDDDRNHHHRKHVKHDHKHKHDKHDWKHGRHDRKHEHVKHHHHRPEFHRTKFERPERARRPEKIERPHRPERPERPERHDRRR